MLRIYLARHGQNEDNAERLLTGHRNRPLTDLGRQQARELGQKMSELGIELDAIYTSPLIRAKETAQIVTDMLRLNHKVNVLDDLIERNFGVMTGRPIDEILALPEEDKLPAGRVTYFLRAEGAETFDLALIRAKRALEVIQREHESGTILLVCHADIGKMMYAAYYGLDWKTVLQQFDFRNSDLILMAEDSLAEDAHVVKIGHT